MRIKGYAYPGYALCCECDPRKRDDERNPVFDDEEDLGDIVCDECGESFADT